MKEPKTKEAQPPKPEGQFVPTDALLEIAGIRHSLEIAIGLWYESAFDEYTKAAVLIEPAVKRLHVICEEDGFPE